MTTLDDVLLTCFSQLVSQNPLLQRKLNYIDVRVYLSLLVAALIMKKAQE